MLNIVIPMPGLNTGFAAAGFTGPTALIPVLGRPMIETVIANIRPNRTHRFVFIAPASDLETTPLRRVLAAAAPGCAIAGVEQMTDGAVRAVLQIRDIIDSGDPLMIAGADQWVDVDMSVYLARLEQQRADGLVMTMRDGEPKWSFVRRDAAGRVVEIVDRQPVSHEATAGVYNFREGRAFVRAAERVLARDVRTGREPSIAAVYNEMLAAGAAIATCNVGWIGNGRWGLGTPEELAQFLIDGASLCC